MKEKKKSNLVKFAERRSYMQINENLAKDNLKPEGEAINKESHTS